MSCPGQSDQLEQIAAACSQGTAEEKEAVKGAGVL